MIEYNYLLSIIDNQCMKMSMNEMSVVNQGNKYTILFVTLPKLHKNSLLPLTEIYFSFGFVSFTSKNNLMWKTNSERISQAIN